MKNKKILTFCATLALVAVAGIGATFAYLTSNTEVLANTFTFSDGISMKLDEDRVDPNTHKMTVENDIVAGQATGNDYLNVLPNEVLHKDPTVTIEANSPDSYVFVSVTNPSADMLSLNIMDSWKLIGKNADTSYYVFVENNQPKVVKSSKTDTRLKEVFTKVTVGNVETKKDGEKVNLGDIVVKASAIQSNVAGEDNFEQVKSEGLALLGYQE